MLSKALSKGAQVSLVHLVSQSENKFKQCILGTRRALSVGTRTASKGI